MRGREILLYTCKYLKMALCAIFIAKIGIYLLYISKEIAINNDKLKIKE